MNESSFIRKIGFAVFFMYISIALPLSVIPVYVKLNLELSSVYAGLSVGSVFMSTLLTRSLAGYHSDRFGGRQSAIVGIVLYLIGNGLCLLAIFFNHGLVYFLLIVGRMVVGVGESYAILGFNTWGISKLGPQFTGRVTGMVGMAMYGALMVGTPIGLEIYYRFGFESVLLLSLITPLIPALFLRRESSDHVVKNTKFRILPAYRKVLFPGAIACFQGIGFAAISAFITLYFSDEQWGYKVFGLTAFGLGFVIVRLFLSHLPDRIGGYMVAFISLIIEGAGQFTLYLSSNITVALAGAFLTGLGCSIIMPAMGVETIRSVGADERGRALGGLSSFQDLAYGLTGPLAGILIGQLGYSSAFLIGGVAASIGIIMLLPQMMRLLKHEQQVQP